MISGAAMVAGVAGAPIAHSLSPYLHGRWIAAAGLDAAYVPFAPTDEAAFRRLVEGFRGGAIRGLNVTAPFKRAAFEIADFRRLGAEASESANLLLFHGDGAIEAASTDGAGMLTAMERRAPDFRVGTALVLGAGGAASAAVAALKLSGFRVRVANRTLAAAEALAEAGGAYGLDALAAAADGADLVVNALSVEPPPMRIAPGTVALDMRYRPHETDFLRAAAKQGAHLVHGIDMLIAQAEPSFDAFFGMAPPEVAGLREAAVRRAGAV